MLMVLTTVNSTTSRARAGRSRVAAYATRTGRGMRSVPANFMVRSASIM